MSTSRILLIAAAVVVVIIVIFGLGIASSYNGLVQSWPESIRLAREGGKPKVEQGALFGETEE